MWKWLMEARCVFSLAQIKQKCEMFCRDGKLAHQVLNVCWVCGSVPCILCRDLWWSESFNGLKFDYSGAEGQTYLTVWLVLPRCVYTLSCACVCLCDPVFVYWCFIFSSISFLVSDSLFSVSPHVHVSHHCRPCVLFFLCVNGQCNSPSEIPSLDTPPGEPPNPPPTWPLEPQIQNQKENQAKKEEGDQTAFIPCIEIHAAGPRRSSEPLPSNLPQPHAEPPLETVTHLIVTSEQRSLSWYAVDSFTKFESICLHY